MDADDLCRLILLPTLLTGLAMGVHYRRRADRAGGVVPRREDGPAIVIGLLGGALCVVGGTVLFVVEPGLMRWAESGVPPALRFAGAPLCVLALLIGRNVFRALGPNVTPTAQTRRNHTLVTDGPYRLVRHPLYLSGFILAAGYWLLTASWLVLLGGCLTLAVISLRTVREEANLVRRFGAEYEAYRARTGRFFPRIRSARASRSRGRQVSGAP